MWPEVMELYLDRLISNIDLPELPNHYSGKVRENFDLPDGRRIIIATDRLSAFDRHIANIPFKGQALTRTTRFWFDETQYICPNHVIAYPDPNVIIAERLDMLPVEIVVRDYLAGSTETSIWTMYERGARDLYGYRLPDGLAKNQKLPETLITPTTKSATHDEPLACDEVVERGLLTAQEWDEVTAKALVLFTAGKRIALEHGLILADTKYEFGRNQNGAIVVGDEIHTPDSSRFWFGCNYQMLFEDGQEPISFDKDVIRKWVGARCDPYHQLIPPIPREILAETASIYLLASEMITGKPFEIDAADTRPAERVARNVRAYLRSDETGFV